MSELTVEELQRRRDDRWEKQRWAMFEITNPTIATVNLMTAAWALGVNYQTARKSAQKNGHIIQGVPVIKIGRNIKVATAPLRNVLGLEIRQ